MKRKFSHEIATDSSQEKRQRITKLSICLDAWCLIGSFLKTKDLGSFSLVNTHFRKLVYDFQIPMNWWLKDFDKLLKNGHASLAKQMLLDEWTDKIMDDDAYFFLKHVEKGHKKVVELLLPYVDPGMCDNEAIIIATNNRHLEITKMLLSDPRVDPSINCNYILRKASFHGHADIVELLLQHAKVNPKDEQKYNKETMGDCYEPEIEQDLEKILNMGKNAIRLALENEHLNVLEVFLKNKKAYPYDYDDKIFQLAYTRNHLEIVKILLKNDTLMDLRNDKGEAIRTACENGYVEMVELFLKDPIAHPGTDEDFPIRIACEKGYDKIVEMLLQHSDVDPNVFDGLPIRLASYHGHDKVVELLSKDPRVDSSAIRYNESSEPFETIRSPWCRTNRRKWKF